MGQDDDKNLTAESKEILTIIAVVLAFVLIVLAAIHVSNWVIN